VKLNIGVDARGGASDGQLGVDPLGGASHGQVGDDAQAVMEPATGRFNLKLRRMLGLLPRASIHDGNM
jgi:hypothetical protein